MWKIRETSIIELKGIGPKKAQRFARLGILTAEDALYGFPREYEDRTNMKMLSEVCDGEQVMVRGTLEKMKRGRYGSGRKRTVRLLIRDETGTMEVLFFNAGYLERMLRLGRQYWFFGKIDLSSERAVMLHPQFGLEEEETARGILPIYPLTSGLTQNDRRRLVLQALELAEEVPECLREDTREINQLCGIVYALKNIHFPLDQHRMRVAKYRLIYEELLLFSLGLNLMKNAFALEKSSCVLDGISYEEEFFERLPYSLTGDQKKTIREICVDMGSGKRMNRLVQGDVGSGKTVVAAAAVYKTIRNGYQAAMMAPTEILARQHFETFEELFAGTGIRVGLLTSGTPRSEKEALLRDCAAGTVDFMIGTHAIFGKGVEYRNLALVVTDEQHRFGVSQREALSEKGKNPHILVMTATPIPRTLALILYGDMDVSVIREKPAGRKEIFTQCYEGSQRDKAYGLARRELRKGRQVYVVAPLIEASEAVDSLSAEEVYEDAKKYFPGVRAALLHGKMGQADKEQIMKDFQSGKIQVLVSTVVIEVGINVPNATVMIIENSERFGLAQMHQLRGRVGRGKEQSYCMLILNGDSQIARQRAETMEHSNDGFEIAEKDLLLRGTGEFFGTRQHGIPGMRIADILRHTKILKRARIEADRIMTEDPLLEQECNRRIKRRIYELYGDLKPGL